MIFWAKMNLNYGLMSFLLSIIPKSLTKMKITFGLQKKHIEHIEAEFQRWKDMPSENRHKYDPKYKLYVWEKLGKELGWCPFTLALYYFQYLEQVSLSNPSNSQ